MNKKYLPELPPKISLADEKSQELAYLDKVLIGGFNQIIDYLKAREKENE